MKKFADICYNFVHGKNDNWKKCHSNKAVTALKQYMASYASIFMYSISDKCLIW